MEFLVCNGCYHHKILEIWANYVNEQFSENLKEVVLDCESREKRKT